MKNKNTLISDWPATTIFLVCILSTLLHGCAMDEHNKTEAEKERALILKHKIKSIKIFQADFKNGMAQQKYLAEERHFNNDGLKTKVINYNSTGKVASVIQLDYDRHFNLIQSIGKSADSGLIFRETRTYNSDDKCKTLTFFLPDGTFKYRNEATYGKDGNVLQLVWYWPEGIRCINKYTYAGQLKITDEEYDTNKQLKYRWQCTYDAEGNKTEAVQYYSDSSITAKINYSYDAENRLIKQTDFIGTSLRKQTFYSYDASGLMVESAEVSAAGNLSSKSYYEYERFD